MSQPLHDFLEWWLPLQRSSGVAFHSGDPSAYLAAWSRREPVTVLGAGIREQRGWPDVARTFDWVATKFADCGEYEYELVAADVQGDLAYTCGFERYTATRPDGTVVSNELRVTQVYRREGGVWRIVHRHGDHAMPANPAY